MGKKINILDVFIDDVTESAALERIDGFIRSGRTHVIAYANPEVIVQTGRMEDYRQFLNAADLVIPDGYGIVYASRLIGTPLKERVAGSDLIYSMARLCAEKGYSIYLLGGKPGVGEEAAARLMALYPTLNISGVQHGYFAPEDEGDLVREIASRKPDVLIVCLGMYVQEMWIKRNIKRLGVPVCFGNGGALDFVSGRAKRAPQWMQDKGLEWLYRLMQEPSRIKRQWVLAIFVLKVIGVRFKAIFLR